MAEPGEKEGQPNAATTEPPKTDTPPSTPATGSDNQGSDKAEIRTIVREELQQALAGLKPAAAPVDAAGSRMATIEALAEQKVAEAAEKLAAKKAKEDGEKEEPLKKAAEQIPAQIPRLRRALWGNDK